MAVMPLSPDPGQLYGRDQHIDYLRTLITQPIDTIQAVLLVGDGGTGKTYLVEDLIKALHIRQIRFLPIYDFYHIDNFKASAIEAAIIRSLERRAEDELAAQPASLFNAYIEQRNRVDQSRQSGTRFQAEQDKLRTAFVDCYNRFAAAEHASGRPVVLLFDTAEQAVDLSDKAANVLLAGHQEAGWGGENWLCRMLPQLTNTLVVLSGRAQTLYGQPVAFYPRLSAAIQAAAGAWHQREIAGIDYPDALAFARRMKQILTRTDEIEEIRGLARTVPIEDDAKMHTWFEIAEGLPFWISMLFTREMLGIVPEGYDPLDAFQERMQEHAGVRLGAAERTELRDAVMQQVLLSTVSNNSAHLIIALQWMAAIRKGLSLEMLRTLLATVPLAIDAETLFGEISRLLIVKQRTVPRYTHGGDEREETLLFLHDEIYRWLGKTELPSDTNALMIDWYTAAIEAAEGERLAAVDTLLEFPGDDAPPPAKPPEVGADALLVSPPHAASDPAWLHVMRQRDDALRRKQQLILDRLGYYFQLSTRRGIQEYNVLAYAAIANRDYGFNVTIRQEGLRNMYRTMGDIPREVEIECAARWLLRAVHADEDWIATLQARVQDYYADEATKPGLHFALLRLAEAQARQQTNPSKDRAGTQALLAEALRIAREYESGHAADHWCGFLLAELLNYRGIDHRLAYEIPDAMQAYRDSLSLHQRYPDLPIEFQANTLNNLAYAYSEQGEVDDARVFALQGLGLRQRFGSEFNVGLSFNTLARIEIRIGNGSKALGYAARAYAIFQRQDATRGLVLCLPVLANAWRKVAEESYDPGAQRRDLQRSLAWFAYTESFFLQRSIGSPERWRELYQQWGCAHRSWALALARRDRQGAEVRAAFAAAHATIEKALEVAENAPLPGLMLIEIHEDLAVIHINQDEYDQRIEDHVAAAEDCAPREYRIRKGVGLPEVSAPTRAYWRCLGQCQLQRMMLNFGKYDFGFYAWPDRLPHQAEGMRTQLEAPGQGKFLVAASEHLLLMEAYLLKYAGSSWILGKAEQLALRELKHNRQPDEIDGIELALLQAARQYNLLNSDALGHALNLISRAKRDLPLSRN